MKRIHTYYIIAAAALLVLLLIVRGCGGKEDSVELGPAETVEAFCRALAAGEFDKAAELCDTISMRAHVEAYRSAYESYAERDEKVVSIASELLKDMEFSIEDIVKDGNRRQVFYTIDLPGSARKEKVATLTKEEGAWKVEEVTDRN